MNNYILNKCIKMSVLDETSQLLQFKLYDRKFNLNGEGVIDLFLKTLKYFIEPNDIDITVRDLSLEYSYETVNKSIKFLIDNNIILPYLYEYQKLNIQDFNELQLLNYFSGCNKIQYCNEVIISGNAFIKEQLGEETMVIVNNENLNNFVNININNFIIFIFDKEDTEMKSLYKNMIKADMKVLPLVYSNDVIEIGPFNINSYSPCYCCLENFIIQDNVSNTNVILNNNSYFNRNNLKASILIAKQELNKVKYGVANSIVSSVIMYDNFLFDIRIHNIIKDYKCSICGGV